jgi:putative membrane protein
MYRTASLFAVIAFFSFAAHASDARNIATSWRMLTSNAGAAVAAIHEAEIEQAKLAVDRAFTPEVRSFAQRMIDHHTAARNEVWTVYAHAQLDLVDDDLARAIRDNGRIAVANLATYPGLSFDRAFMQAQVAQHRYAYNTLERLSYAQLASARKAFESQREMALNHYNQARKLHRLLPKY